MSVWSPLGSWESNLRPIDATCSLTNRRQSRRCRPGLVPSPAWLLHATARREPSTGKRDHVTPKAKRAPHLSPGGAVTSYFDYKPELDSTTARPLTARARSTRFSASPATSEEPVPVPRRGKRPVGTDLLPHFAGCVDEVAFPIRCDQEFLAHAGLFPDEHRLPRSTAFPAWLVLSYGLGPRTNCYPPSSSNPPARPPNGGHQNWSMASCRPRHRALLSSPITEPSLTCGPPPVSRPKAQGEPGVTCEVERSLRDATPAIAPAAACVV